MNSFTSFSAYSAPAYMAQYLWGTHHAHTAPSPFALPPSPTGEEASARSPIRERCSDGFVYITEVMVDADALAEEPEEMDWVAEEDPMEGVDYSTPMEGVEYTPIWDEDQVRLRNSRG